MTVKSLTDAEKLYIAGKFRNGFSTINELAAEYMRSRRTIIRTLTEQGADPGIKTRAKKVKPVSVPVVIPTKTPWYRRVIESVNDLRWRIGGLGV